MKLIGLGRFHEIYLHIYLILYLLRYFLKSNMGICCQSTPDANRGGNQMKVPEQKEEKVDLKKRGSIRPSVAHRDKKLVRDYTLGI